MGIALAITIIYVAVLFGVCGWASKREKERVARGEKASFLMAGKNLPLALIIVLTAGASIGGATTTGIAQLVQTAGVSAIWYGVANVIGLLFLGIVGAGRIRKFGYSTNAEMIAEYCGPTSRYMMVVGQLIIILGVACLQYVSGGAMLASMFPSIISYNMGVAITAIAFTIVCLLGGLYGASLANLINVVVIYISMIICMIVAVVNAGGWSTLISQVSTIQESTTYGGSWLSLTGGLGVATILSYLVSEPGNRITTQSNTMACSAANSVKSARWGIIIGAILIIPVCIMAVIFGLIAKIQYPDVASAQAMSTVIMSLNPVLAGFGMAGLWAVTVSTGVALMMSSIQLVCYDILAPIKSIRNKQAESSASETEKREKYESRIVLLILFIITLILAYKAVSIVGVIVTVLCITPAFFWIMLAMLFFPQLLKKHTAQITQGAAYIFFFAWLLIPAVKQLFPTPIYVEWPLCTVVFFLCYFFDREPIKIPEDKKALYSGKNL